MCEHRENPDCLPCATRELNEWREFALSEDAKLVDTIGYVLLIGAVAIVLLPFIVLVA